MEQRKAKQEVEAKAEPDTQIKHLTPKEVAAMTTKEGLVLQGCGGDLAEWVNGINEMLTEYGVFKDGNPFTEVSTFKMGEVTNLLFHMDEELKLDIGKLAMWRISTYETFGATWLSDYIPNRLSKYSTERQEQGNPLQEKEKPHCPLIGQDGNVFNLIGVARKTLNANGFKDEAKEMSERVKASGSYNEALSIICEYVTPVSAFDIEEEFEECDPEYKINEGMGGIE